MTTHLQNMMAHVATGKPGMLLMPKGEGLTGGEIFQKDVDLLSEIIRGWNLPFDQFNPLMIRFDNLIDRIGDDIDDINYILYLSEVVRNTFQQNNSPHLNMIIEKINLLNRLRDSRTSPNLSGKGVDNNSLINSLKRIKRAERIIHK